MSTPSGSTEPAPAPGSGLVLGYLLSITTWRRALIAVFLGVTTLVLWLVYQNPQQVFELASGVIYRKPVSEQPYLTPLTSDIHRVLDAGFPQFLPDAIGIAALRVELQANVATVVVWATKPDYAESFKQLYEERWRYGVPLFGDDPEVNNAVARAYIGRFHCLKDLDGFEALRRFPVKEVCVVGIPPDGYGLGGMIIIAFEKEVPWDRLAPIERGMRGIAAALTWWPRPLPTH